MLDEEPEAWRNLFLDARYEKGRMDGAVRNAAVLSAIGIGPDERRRGLGVSIALSEAEAHWRAWSKHAATAPRNLPNGWRKTCPRALPSLPFPSITAAACAPRT
ncbi:transposase [Jhaorihella thermophila]|uniref:transposase n=1 Tax=Jhaorihella thermophila TaxID=488547 RepID=UPI003617FFDA